MMKMNKARTPIALPTAEAGLDAMDQANGSAVASRFTFRRSMRQPLIGVAVLTLLVALWAGLIRIGWVLPPIQATLPAVHGPLMVCGFLGVLLGLERAVALLPIGRSNSVHIHWPYAAPFLTALGSLVLMIGVVDWPGPLFITLGSAGLAVIFVAIIRRQPTLFTAVMGIGALSWLIGNALWLTGHPIYTIVIWWVGFPLLTIAGERLELSRLLKLSAASRVAFAIVIGIFLIGATGSVFDLDTGTRLAGIGEIGLAVWLFRYDIARRTVHRSGVTRFIAVCLLSGYVWLGVGGVLSLTQGGTVAGPHYDAMLHTLFLGFAFAMIFGHAPIILPAILRLPPTFRPIFYTHLGLLHGSLLIRVGGDLAGDPTIRQWGGLLNACALLLFLANTGWAYWSARRTPHEVK